MPMKCGLLLWNAPPPTRAAAALCTLLAAAAAERMKPSLSMMRAFMSQRLLEG